jgi:hypothetical protein
VAWTNARRLSQSLRVCRRAQLEITICDHHLNPEPEP